MRVFNATGQTETSGTWCTDYVRNTCLIRDSETPTKLLGGVLGDGEHQNTSFGEIANKSSQLHEAITGVSDPATQMTLRLACTGACKISYVLRLFGDRLGDACFEELDAAQRAGVSMTLEGDIGDLAWEQAQVGISGGGLGIRDASDLALPAFVSSRVAARPVAKGVFTSLEEDGLAPAGVLLAAYDLRTEAAADRMLAPFARDPSVVDAVRTDLRRAAEDSELWWRLVESGDEATDQAIRGCDTDEQNAVELQCLHSSFPIQARITKHFDRLRLEKLRDKFEALGQEEDVRRLDDLQDSHHQEHTWWQSLDTAKDRVLPRAEWVTAMRVRLGAPVLLTDRIVAAVARRWQMRAATMLSAARGQSQQSGITGFVIAWAWYAVTAILLPTLRFPACALRHHPCDQRMC